MKREVPVEEAVGLTLAHDMTRIVPGEFKGPAFTKGHVVREEDIPLLLDIGKRNVWVLQLDEDELHENDAAQAMAKAVAGPGVLLTDVHEGKVVLKAAHDGMIWVDEDKVLAMNAIEDISVITRRPYLAVQKGMSIAAVRPIPLTIAAAKVEKVAEISAQRTGGGVIDVLPFQPQRVALVTTGSEIESGRIEDKFGPALRSKFAAFGIAVETQVLTGDDADRIAAAIVQACDDGATLVCVTGGMSVDPDDRSPGAIRRAATDVVTYGTPMLPGSMLMLAYRGNTAIVGLPGAVMYDKVTSFDVLLPRLLAGVRLSRHDIAIHGVGGWLNE